MLHESILATKDIFIVTRKLTYRANVNDHADVIQFYMHMIINL